MFSNKCGVKNKVMGLLRGMTRCKEEKKTVSRREHNDTLYFLRHGKAPIYTHPDDMAG